MIRNYIKIAFRNILKHKVFSIINIFGLALSMSVCLLIISMIVGLSQYDRFHEHYDHIYRVLCKKTNQSTFSASASMPVRQALLKDYTGIKKVVTFKKGFGGDASYQDTTVPLFGFFCSEDLFEVFSFKLKMGNPANSLRDPYSVILTLESAKKLFGESNPIGKIISFNERGLVSAGIPNKNTPTYLGDYTVTGVLDEASGKTHLEFDILASLNTLPLLELQGKENALVGNWDNIDQTYHYVLLEYQRNASYFQGILDQMSNSTEAIFDNYSIIFKAQPFSKITPGKLYRNPFSMRLPIQVIYFLALLAAIVILSACFNYTSLSLAKSLSRAKEVGIRKISGAYRYQILGQFIGESIIISIISLLLAIGILQLLKPAFSSLWFTKYIKVDMAENLSINLIFLAFSVLIGIFAGIIPAFYLSSFKPLKVLKDVNGLKMFRKITIRKALIIAQFSTSLFFIITTILIYYQLNYMMQSDYGFKKENIINVPLQGNKFELFTNQIKNHSGISRVSGSSMILATGGTSYTYLKKIDEMNDSTGVSLMFANRNFIENFELSIIAGKNFPEVLSDKAENFFIANEVTVKKLGYKNIHDIIGEAFIVDGLDNPLTVLGIVKDFHYSHLIQEIGPFIIRYNPEEFMYANVRVNPEYQEGILIYMEDKWKELDKSHAFEFQFMDQQLAESHEIFGDIGFIIGFISILVVSIAGLGLLGMVIFVTQTKVKEIGIRKVHGASLNDAVWVLSKGFLILLLISVLIATPLAKIANEVWLREFAVRIEFGFEILTIGILIMLIIGLFTIFSQTIKSSRRNPVETLKYE